MCVGYVTADESEKDVEDTVLSQHLFGTLDREEGSNMREPDAEILSVESHQAALSVVGAEANSVIEAI